MDTVTPAWRANKHPEAPPDGYVLYDAPMHFACRLVGHDWMTYQDAHYIYRYCSRCHPSMVGAQ